MWKELKISEQTYFIYCNFNENTQDITFILYDFQVTWCQTIHFRDVKHKIKLLNKRFDFNEDNMKEALTSDAIQSAALEDTKNPESCLLKLKYRVKNCLLNYEWCLRKQNLLEFQQTIVRPILLTLLECQQQIEILADSVRKKDIELKQFRMEGAVLNRKTLITKPFDFDDFKTKFENCNKITNNFKDLAKYVKETERCVATEIINKNGNKTEENIMSAENKEQDLRPNIKMSPRQKKRKANEMKMQHLQHHLKLWKQGLEYESSQSQTQSSASSQTTEEFGVKHFKLASAKEQEKSKPENPSSSRKITRFSKLNQNPQKLSDDKTDSDYNNCLKAPGDKSNRKSPDSRKNASRFTNVQETKGNSKNGSSEETKQIKLNNTRKEASSENISSNVFDFFTESDDEIGVPLARRANAQKKKLEQKNDQNSNHKKPKNNTLLSFNKSSMLDIDRVNSINSSSPHNSLSHSSTPVIINEISTQLDNIKKELENLEAMRLADLQKRIH